MKINSLEEKKKFYGTAEVESLGLSLCLLSKLGIRFEQWFSTFYIQGPLQLHNQPQTTILYVKSQCRDLLIVSIQIMTFNWQKKKKS